MESMVISETSTTSEVDVEEMVYAGSSVSLNAYGSPIAHRRQRNEGEAVETASVAVVNRVTCSCKNTCSRKKTTKTPGCPCKNAALKCSTNCTCGTKKTACKNKASEIVVNRNPSAFARHQEQVVIAEREIQDFINTLATDEKDKILLRLLSQGRGSLEYAKNIREEIDDSAEPDPRPDPDANTPEWCDCSVCRPMPLDMENVCCKKRTCVTSYIMFQNICLDREVLTLAIRARFDIMAEEADYSTNSYRKAAYRQYCLWKYGKLGKGNRRVLPSCTVLTIRRFYPAPDGLYMGYRPS